MSIWIYIGIIVAMLILAKFLAWPLKLIFKLLLNIILGAVLIMVINWLGGSFGISIPFNEFTAVIVGILGLPGALLVWLFNSIF